MNDLHFPGTTSTPDIAASVSEGCLRLQGESYPENAYELFGPVFQWLEDFLQQYPERSLCVELELLYLNTSSIKAVMDVFDLLEDAHQQGRQVSVRWLYDAENERVGELAEEFREDCTFPFHVLSK